MLHACVLRTHTRSGESERERERQRGRGGERYINIYNVMYSFDFCQTYSVAVMKLVISSSTVELPNLRWQVAPYALGN